MSSTELTANLPQGINTITVVRVAGKATEASPALKGERLESREIGSLMVFGEIAGIPGLFGFHGSFKFVG
jgi:hypothetical protein